MRRHPLIARLIAPLVLAASAGMAEAGSIATTDAAVATLADGRTGTIAFEAPTPRSGRALAMRKVTEEALIAGVLTLPAGAGPAAKVPAMVVVHGSSGVLKNEWEWAQRLNAMGVATFVIDNFTGRGVSETATDQSRLSPAADVAGALAALRLLATHPAIDEKRIGVIGFSRGGSAALNAALEPIRRGVIDDGLRFAAHVAVYPGCAVAWVSAHLDGSPILMLLGGKDDYTPAAFCLAYADRLRARGASISVIVYPDAYHGFDSAAPPRFRPGPTTLRKCHGEIDLDDGALTMERGDDKATGKDAGALLKDCVEHGVTVGGDPEARERAPNDVANFLKAIFAASR
ncbi:dienelactone hydrolase [Roseiarcus fermentans]|uniref:Dienelactone hydrolase n=1 Tax=Roseiarcus fermentans TaxID=1473586 RepID=A0A366F3G0_9HYPH|nr:dienelactone hydrolase family protein [Roseiarcus fermentans]RBP09178.1 dienelactone hydrolase [Roseiarcus fermentans]